MENMEQGLEVTNNYVVEYRKEPKLRFEYKLKIRNIDILGK